MSGGTLTKVTGACCGLAAFAIAVVAGLAAENPGEVILFRAIISMFLCQILGIGVGIVIEHVTRASIEAHKLARPDPLEAGDGAGNPATASSFS